MGYTITYNSFQRVREFLDILKRSQEPVKWEVKNPKKFVYMMHNGLMTAKALKIPGYDHLKDSWEIRTKEAEKLVIATPRDSDEVVPILTVEGLSTPFDVVNKMIALKGSQQKVVFTDIKINVGGAKLIENWCNFNNYTVTIGENDIVIVQRPSES